MALKLTKFHDRLFVRGHTRGLDSGEVLRELQKHDIRFVLNVALIDDHWIRDAARLVGIKCEHHPLHDSKNIDVPKVIALIKDVVSSMQYYGVLVHCDSGWNRSSLIAIPALAVVMNEPAADVLRVARLMRPKILKNPRFEEFVVGESWRSNFVQTLAEDHGASSQS